jgi:ankyrin repeat protein
MNWLALLVVLVVILAAMMTIGCGYHGLIRGGSMSIWEAVEREDLDAIQAYVERGGNLEVGATRRGKTPLLHALILKKPNSYSKLLALGANPNTLCRGGGAIQPPNSSVMHHAALEEDPFWLRAALESGGDPNQMNGGKGQQNGTPLQFAIMKQRIENVKLLCEHGTDLDAPIDHYGRTALYLACGSFEIVYCLLEHGADFSEPRPVHELHSFLYMLQHMKPGYPAMTAHNQKWFTVVWEWLQERAYDPEKARWNGSKWVWD